MPSCLRKNRHEKETLSQPPRGGSASDSFLPPFVPFADISPAGGIFLLRKGAISRARPRAGRQPLRNLSGLCGDPTRAPLQFLIPHSSLLIPHSSFLTPHSSFLIFKGFAASGGRNPGSAGKTRPYAAGASPACAQRTQSSPFSTSTVRVAPAESSPERMRRASRVSTPLCRVRRSGRAPKSGS